QHSDSALVGNRVVWHIVHRQRVNVSGNVELSVHSPEGAERGLPPPARVGDRFTTVAFINVSGIFPILQNPEADFANHKRGHSRNQDCDGGEDESSPARFGPALILLFWQNRVTFQSGTVGALFTTLHDTIANECLALPYGRNVHWLERTIFSMLEK